MLRFFFGVALAPAAVLILAAAMKSLALTGSHAASARPFLLGFAIPCLFWLSGLLEDASGPVSRFLSAAGRRTYIFGHELTHALAAWSFGAKVLDFRVGRSSGHVGVSRSNLVVALAPYFVPVYTLICLVAWRLLLFFKPALPSAPFLALVGLTLAFHLLKTADCLWGVRQPDLSAAGGTLFSLSLIGTANGVMILLLLKALFPVQVSLSGELSWAAGRALAFWRAVGGLGRAWAKAGIGR